MKLKQLLCSALSVAMLSTAALAAPVAPVAKTDAPAYTITDRKLSPVLVWGKAVDLTDNKISLENDSKDYSYPKIVANITDDTLILDAATGAKKAFADLKKDESLYAYVSPAMTRSNPPQTNAILVLCNLPADLAAPTYAEIQQVTKNEDGSITATTDRDVIYHVSKETALIAAPGADKAGVLEDLKPGTQVLAWYQIVALSMPAQATPTKLMIFPYAYRGYLSADQQGVAVNGKALTLTATEQPIVQDGKLMLPVRKLAEALGCQVVWSAAKPNEITIQQDGKDLYPLTLNANTTLLAGQQEIALAAPVTVAQGVTFMAADDFLTFHNLKLDTAQASNGADAAAPVPAAQ